MTSVVFSACARALSLIRRKRNPTVPIGELLYSHIMTYSSDLVSITEINYYSSGIYQCISGGKHYFGTYTIFGDVYGQNYTMRYREFFSSGGEFMPPESMCNFIRSGEKGVFIQRKGSVKDSKDEVAKGFFIFSNN